MLEMFITILFSGDDRQEPGGAMIPVPAVPVKARGRGIGTTMQLAPKT
jgi:hypothetical protein